MGKKAPPKVEPSALYELCERYYITYEDNSVFGKYLSNRGGRCQSYKESKSFETYVEAVQYIEDMMLEGVSITKVFV